MLRMFPRIGHPFLLVAFLMMCVYIVLISRSSRRARELVVTPFTASSTASAVHVDPTSVLPSIVLFSLYLGESEHLHYSYLDLTVRSMAWNPSVDFVLLNVVSDAEYEKPAPEVSALVPYEIEAPSNFRVERVSYSRLQRLIAERLGVHVPVSKEWSYKMAEYKPTYAHLFSELLVHPSTGVEYQWWGYADLDVIWGNISHFAPLFHRGHPIINSGWLSPRGMCTFYINEPWTRVIFRADPLYVHLLANRTYMNLDENGLSTRPESIVDEGIHSLTVMQWTALTARKQTAYHGKSANDRLFAEKIDSVNWAGPVRWSRGTLKIVRQSKEFPAMRELMFYHRAFDGFNAPKGILRRDWVEDMLEYGFLLPFFVPLLSRYICPGTSVGNFHSNMKDELRRYAPYAKKDCLKQ